MSTITQATSGQKKQNNRFLEDVFQALRTELETMFGELDTENAQRFLGNGDEFKADVQKVAFDSFGRLSISNQFASEEVSSEYGYLSGYQKPKGLTEQANRLRELFSGAGFVNLDLQGRIEKGEVALPANCEGWSVIPNWMKNPGTWGATYNEALQKVLDAIKKTRNGKFQNYREGQIGPERLRQTKRTEKFFRELSEAQGNPDLLIVPTQFGIRHRGRSVRRACEVFVTSEFGLGAFAVGIMLLTHPERLMNCDDLWIDCAGDEYDDPDSDVRFDNCPYFNFNDGRVEFGASWFGFASEGCGSASAVVPQI